MGDEPPGLSEGQRSPGHYHGGRSGTVHHHICGRNVWSCKMMKYEKMIESQGLDCVLSSRVNRVTPVSSPIPALFTAETFT